MKERSVEMRSVENRKEIFMKQITFRKKSEFFGENFTRRIQFKHDHNKI